MSDSDTTQNPWNENPCFPFRSVPSWPLIFLWIGLILVVGGPPSFYRPFPVYAIPEHVYQALVLSCGRASEVHVATWFCETFTWGLIAYHGTKEYVAAGGEGKDKGESRRIILVSIHPHVNVKERWRQGGKAGGGGGASKDED